MPTAGIYLKELGYSRLRGLFRRMFISGKCMGVETTGKLKGCLRYEKAGKNINDSIITIWNPTTKSIEKKIIVENDYLFQNSKQIKTVRKEIDGNNRVLSAITDTFEKTEHGTRPLSHILENHSVEPPIITARSYDYSTGVARWNEVTTQGREAIGGSYFDPNVNNGKIKAWISPKSKPSEPTYQI